MDIGAPHRYEFGPYFLDPTECRLLRDDQVVPLTPKLFDLLLVLVQNGGRTLKKEELLQAVWPDAIVEENNLTVTISALRKVLGEEAGTAQYIETVPRRGYRFVAEVRELADEVAEQVAREHPNASVVTEEKKEEREIQGEEETERQGAELSPPAPLSRAARLPRFRSLSFLLVLLVIGLMLGTAYWWKAGRAKPTKIGLKVESIAVLPFKPLRPDEEGEYLGLGLADTLITKLSSLPSLIVRPTSAVLKYSGSTQDPLVAGREQKVDAVLDASLQRDGERIRVTVRLLNVRNGAALWAYQCEEVLCNNLFAMQDVISEQVAAELMPRLTGAERGRLRKHFTENKEAYQDYVKGRYFWNQRTLEGVKKGIEYFEQAIAKDPNYALAYVGLANCYSVLTEYGWAAPKECFPKAKLAALKAIGIDDELAEAHASLAQILHLYDWNWAEAEREFRRTIELSPGYAYAHQWYGVYLGQLGRFDEAKAELKRALELDPVSLGNNIAYADPFHYSRDYDQAIVTYQKTLELDPNWFVPHWKLAQIYELKGMYDQAFAEYLTHHTLTKTSPEWIEEFKRAYAASGIRGYWQKRLALVQQRSTRGYVSKVGRAIHHLHLGEQEEALYWLQQACDDRDPQMVKLTVEPLFDGLRSDPRFVDLLRRVGLAP